MPEQRHSKPWGSIPLGAAVTLLAQHGASAVSRRLRRTCVVGGFLLALLVPHGASATFPGENGLIAYQGQTDAGVQLFTMRPDGSDIRQITHIEPRLDADIPGAGLPDWSPDGRTLAFTVNDCQLALVGSSGGEVREVPFEPGRTVAGFDLCELDPSFTPDGRSLVYERWDQKYGHDEVWMVNLDGTDRHQITDACAIDPNVSPDGTRLSCRAGDAPGALMVVYMDGTGASLLSPPSGISFKNDWAPDGRAIVFSDEFREGSPAGANVVVVAPDGTDVRYLTDEEANTGANNASYSPDGTSIVYRVHNADDVCAAFVMDADDGGARQITEWASCSLYNRLDWGSVPSE